MGKISVNPNLTGSVSEIRFMAKLVSLGYTVLTPIGGFHKVDCVALKDAKIFRIQIKTGSIRKGAVFAKASCSHEGKAYSKDEVDLLGIYCPDNDKYYLMPTPLTAHVALRIDPPRNNQTKGVVYAKDFEI